MSARTGTVQHCGGSPRRLCVGRLALEPPLVPIWTAKVTDLLDGGLVGGAGKGFLIDGTWVRGIDLGDGSTLWEKCFGKKFKHGPGRDRGNYVGSIEWRPGRLFVNPFGRPALEVDPDTGESRPAKGYTPTPWDDRYVRDDDWKNGAAVVRDLVTGARYPCEGPRAALKGNWIHHRGPEIVITQGARTLGDLRAQRINVTNGRLLWTIDDLPFELSSRDPVLDDVLYTGQGAVDLKKGRVLWEAERDRLFRVSHVLGGTPNAVWLVEESIEQMRTKTRWRLVARRTRDGKVLWTHDVDKFHGFECFIDDLLVCRVGAKGTDLVAYRSDRARPRKARSSSRGSC